ETTAADHVAPNLLTAVRAVLTGPPWGRILADERPLRNAYATGERPAPGRAGRRRR
ncbi:haloacid dehalogenase, partial [Streptomyces sp. NTH33]